MVRTLVVSTFVLLALVPSASASSAGVQGSTLSVTATGGEQNRFAVSASGSVLRVNDGGATLQAGAGCKLYGRTVSCPAAGITDVVVDAGDRDDRVDISRSVVLRVRVQGGAGDDTMIGGLGPDELDGGPGRDTVTYAGRPEAVAVTLAGGADDGAPGEGDNVIAVERLVGGRGSDTLVGSAAAEAIDGREGDDRIDGGAGNDSLTGGPGDDALSGGEGNDTFVAAPSPDGRDVFAGGPGSDLADYAARSGGVVADPDGRADDGDLPGRRAFSGPVPAIAALSSTEGDNVLPDVESVRGGGGDDVLALGAAAGRATGGAGTDVLVGGPANDTLDGGAGFDRLLARDGHKDRLVCGAAGDRAFVDGADRPGSDCESVVTSFAVRLAPVTRVVGGDGALRARVACPAQAAIRCVGAVRLVTVRRVGHRVTTLGAARFNVPSGTAQEVTIALTRRGRAALHRLGGATRVRLAARGRDEAGAARPAAARFILRTR